MYIYIYTYIVIYICKYTHKNVYFSENKRKFNKYTATYNNLFQLAHMIYIITIQLQSFQIHMCTSIEHNELSHFVNLANFTIQKRLGSLMRSADARKFGPLVQS